MSGAPSTGSTLVALAVVALAAPAAAQGTDPACPEKVECLPEGDLFPARRLEGTFVAVSHVTYNRPASDELAFRLGAGFEGGLLFADAQEFRPSFYLEATAGDWGDDRHGGFDIEAGTKLRASFFPTRQIFDLYPVLGAGLVFGSRDDWHAGARFSAGLGVRELRALSAEVSLDYLTAFDGPFPPKSRADVWGVPGLSTLIGFDLCALGDVCDIAPPKQRTEDLTCCAYMSAKKLCGAPAPEKAALCEAARDALDADAHPPGPDEDSAGAFLRTLTERLAKGHAVEQVAKDHARLRGWRSAGRGQERLAARRDRAVAVRRSYAPYPTELLAALGCAADAAAAPCELRCDGAAPSEAACAAATP